MATAKEKEELRLAAMEKYAAAFTETDVLVTASNQRTIPVTTPNGEELYIVATFSIPIGSRDGDPYDGYEVAKEYADKLETDKVKRQEQAEAKARKIAKDKARRAKKKKEDE